MSSARLARIALPAADDFGDLSLLVLSRGRPGLAKGQVLTSAPA